MEMPINVVITLFVGLLVGGLIVFFAQNIVFSSEQQFIEFLDEEENGFFDLKEITESQIGFLVKSCYEKSFGESLDNELCYIVHGESPAFLDSDKVFEFSGVEAEVSNETSKFFLIEWNAKENIVEVTT